MVCTESCRALNGAIEHLGSLKALARKYNDLFSVDWVHAVKKQGWDARGALEQFIEGIRTNRHDAATVQLRLNVCTESMLNDISTHYRYAEIRAAVPEPFFSIDFGGYSKEAYAHMRNEDAVKERNIWKSIDAMREYFFAWHEEASTKSEASFIELRQFASESNPFDMREVVRPMLFLDVVLSGEAKRRSLAEAFDVIDRGVKGEMI